MNTACPLTGKSIRTEGVQYLVIHKQVLDLDTDKSGFTLALVE
jgi:hypothetical protein